MALNEIKQSFPAQNLGLGVCISCLHCTLGLDNKDKDKDKFVSCEFRVSKK
jgi:hypothetical protein